MSLPLVFHTKVEGDIDKAYHWYEKQRAGLGEDFLSAIEEMYLRLQVSPKGHPTVYRTVRRASPRRFPYGIFYRLHADRIEVLAVQHSRQNPRRWQSRA